MTSFPVRDVSRETFDALEHFVALVEKWTKKINLISKSSAEDIWDRHIVDSAQIFNVAPSQGHWVDLGSGGGFPAIVLAILSKGRGAAHQFTLVESDQRKCAFLRTSIRELDLPATVMSKRIEAIEPFNADILSARALADLSTLLSFCEKHMKPSGIAIFPKGETWQKEHQAASAHWSYSCEDIKSKTNAATAVLRIQDISRV